MKKQILFSIVFLLLIVNVSAISFSPTLPSQIDLRCEENYNTRFSSTSGDITNLSLGTISSSTINYFMSVMQVSSDAIYVSFQPTGDCRPGSSTFTFTINGEQKSFNINVVEDLWNLFGEGEEKIIFENERLNIGSAIGISVIDVGDVVTYKLTGCDGSNNREVIEKGSSKDYECGEEKIIIDLIRTFSSIDAASFRVFASNNWMTSITQSNETYYDESECVLGLDTLGAKVKRGNIFAIKTINANSGKFVDKVAVMILDQQGELSPISGESSNIGFFSERLHEEYLQDLIVQLEKDGCEPSTQVILFERSYDDYKTAKQEEDGAYQLVLTLEPRYEMSIAISNTIKNALGIGVDGATIRITKPDNSYFDITADASGVFSTTPDQVGKWKFQASKDDYTPSNVSEIEVFQNKQYLIRIKVDGKSDFTKYRKGDMITFSLFENETIIPLTIDGTFAGLPINFIDGISNQVELKETSTLSIPAIKGYTAQSITLEIKEFNWSNVGWSIGIIIGIVILIIIIVLIIKKVKGGGSFSSRSIPKAIAGADINLGE